MKISFQYADGDEESVLLSDFQAQKELKSFLNRFSDSGKKQWMSKIKGKDRPLPLQDEHYSWVAENYQDSLSKQS